MKRLFALIIFISLFAGIASLAAQAQEPTNPQALLDTALNGVIVQQVLESETYEADSGWPPYQDDITNVYLNDGMHRGFAAGGLFVGVDSDTTWRHSHRSGSNLHTKSE